MKLAPIVIFAYNRPDKILRTINSLKKNNLAKFSILYIICDGINKSKKDDNLKVNCVHQILKNISGFKKVNIIYRNKNLGLYKNITSGLDYIFKKNKKAIILEDDIVVSKFFLKYMNESLILYEHENKVATICSNLSKDKEKLPNTFFLYHQDCWGWAAWRRSWKLFNHDSSMLLKKIKDQKLEKKFNLENQYDFLKLLEENKLKRKSWAINWYASLFVNKKLNLYSSAPMSKNIGFGKDSTNTRVAFKVLETTKKNINYKKIPIKESKKGYNAIVNFYKNKIHKTKFNYFEDRLKRKIKSLKTITKNILEGEKNKFFFKGPFDKWKDAVKNSEGYSSKKIIDKLFKAATLVKNKKFAYERDTVLFSEPAYNWLILHKILKYNYNKENANLNLIDFGGSLGSTYFQHQLFLDLFRSVKWNIVEQRKIVEIGNKFFKNKNLKFYNDLDQALKKSKSKFIILDNVLQYIENPSNIIDILSRYKGMTIIINQIFFTKKIKDLIIVQKTPKRIYDTSYPLRIFSKNKFLKRLKKHFKIIENNKNSNSFDLSFNNTNYISEYLIVKS